MKTSLKVFLFFILIGFSLSPLSGKEKLKVGFSIFEPWKILKDSKPTGIDVKILEAIARKENLELDFFETPFKRCLKNMETGTVDIMTSLLKRKEREQYIYYIEPPYQKKSNKAFYMLNRSNVKVINYKSLKNLRIGVKLGVKYFKKFDSDNTLKKITSYKNEQTISKLLNHGIDIFVMTEKQGDYLIKKMSLSHRIEKCPYILKKDNPAYIGISRKSKFSNPNFINLISEMIKNRTIGKIIENNSSLIH